MIVFPVPAPTNAPPKAVPPPEYAKEKEPAMAYAPIAELSDALSETLDRLMSELSSIVELIKPSIAFDEAEAPTERAPAVEPS